MTVNKQNLVDNYMEYYSGMGGIVDANDFVNKWFSVYNDGYADQATLFSPTIISGVDITTIITKNSIGEALFKSAILSVYGSLMEDPTSNVTALTSAYAQYWIGSLWSGGSSGIVDVYTVVPNVAAITAAQSVLNLAYLTNVNSFISNPQYQEVDAIAEQQADMLHTFTTSCGVIASGMINSYPTPVPFSVPIAIV